MAVWLVTNGVGRRTLQEMARDRLCDGVGPKISVVRLRSVPGPEPLKRGCGRAWMLKYKLTHTDLGKVLAWVAESLEDQLG